VQQPLIREQVHDWSNVAGPVALAYEMDLSPITGICGPTGGGKTFASARKFLRVALDQHPSPRDGIRKCRIYCVAPTYRVLWDTVIPSYRKIWPSDPKGYCWGDWYGSKGDPADHSFDLELANAQGGVDKLHLEMKFRAAPESEEDVDEFFQGKETTGWWFPELATQRHRSLLEIATNRVGRYPDTDDRPTLVPGMKPAWAGVYGDMNVPYIGSWAHERIYLRPLPGDRWYFQPAFDSPGAENLHNLHKIRLDYYEHMASTMSEHAVNRLLRCKPGWSRAGKPVHEAFDIRDHVSRQAIEPSSDVLLEIGADAGGTLSPAATFGQRVMGQSRVLDEIAPKTQQMDLMEFALEVRRLRETRFRHVRDAVIYVDPSARAASITNRQLTFAQILQQQSGVRVVLAPTNSPGPRRTALDRRLKMRNGYIVDERCVGLIEAMAGGYCFGKIKRQTGETWSETPVKNQHSHIADAEQYRILGSEGIGAGGLINPPARAAQAAGSGVLLP
jgi:hypothetical protein